VLPDAAVAIAGDLTAVAAEVSTRRMVGSSCFAESYAECRVG
jgi:hypothetical protein